jgi:hypothetical protein
MRLKCAPLILLFLLPLFNSCINNADFDQIDLNAEPVIEAPLVFFELTQFDFLDDTGIETATITDVTDLDFFQTSTVRDNLQRVDIVYTVQNEFNRNYTITAELLDANGDVTFSIAPLVMNPTIDFVERREIIRIELSPFVLNTTQIRFTVTLGPGAPLDTDVERRIRLESIGIFYLSLD